MQAIKLFFLKAYFTVALVYDQNLPPLDRSLNFLKTLLAFGPIVFILEKINIWFDTHQGFVIGVVVLILLNMVFGGIVYRRKKEFDWKTLLMKTNEMMVILILSYFTLEIILSVAGESDIVTAFRISIQVSTLLYPGSKILKNLFIFSKGKYPPKWLMTKVYNFQENGDLQAFLKTSIPEANHYNPHNDERPLP